MTRACNACGRGYEVPETDGLNVGDWFCEECRGRAIDRRAAFSLRFLIALAVLVALQLVSWFLER